MKTEFKYLDKPLRIGKMLIRNRLAYPPMNFNYANECGAPTKLMIDHYARRAKGGVGLITVEATAVDDSNINHGGQPRLTQESLLPMWSRLTDKIHRYGSKVSVELNHWGAEARLSKKVSCSDVTSKGNLPVHPMTKEEIWECEDKYARAALLAKRAGFDAITLHGAHGCLISQFLSPIYNKRTDCYGGSIENRARFIVEIVEKCRKSVGNDFPIIVRISNQEYLKSGRTLEETIEVAKILEKSGVDAIDISGGHSVSYVFSIAPETFPGMHGMMLPSAKKIKEAVNIPTIAAGAGMCDPNDIEKALADGVSDMISVGRQFIADENFGVKSLTGNFKDVRPCLYCMNCFNVMMSGRVATCSVNPETGREDDLCGIQRAFDNKKVLVVGGGAAGLEAARVAALRGHTVTLIEKEDKLGGTLRAASVPPHKGRIGKLVEWYEWQMSILGVEVKLNTPYQKDLSKDFDNVIFACGAEYAKRIQGSEGKNVFTAKFALNHPELVGDKVVIIGGGASGCETAEFFGTGKYEIDIKCVNDFKGGFIFDKKLNENASYRKVTVVEMLDDICTDMDIYNKMMMKLNLKENDIDIMTSTRVEEIKNGYVTVMNMKNSRKLTLEADTVILAGGLVPSVVEEMPENAEIHFVGDCNKPGRIIDAVLSGYMAAVEL